MNKPINMEIVSKIEKYIELDSIYLLKSECNLIDEYFLNKKSGKLEIQQAINASTKELVPKEKVKILIDFKLNTIYHKNLEDEDKKIVFFINASFILLYSFSDKNISFSKDDLDMFAHINSVFNCYSYWREFVQSTSTKMGLPPLTIPLFKITKLPLSKKRIKAEKKK